MSLWACETPIYVQIESKDAIFVTFQTQIGLSAFFLRPGSMGIAPLQHKGRLTLSFSPTW